MDVRKGEEEGQVSVMKRPEERNNKDMTIRSESITCAPRVEVSVDGSNDVIINNRIAFGGMKCFS